MQTESILVNINADMLLVMSTAKSFCIVDLAGTTKSTTSGRRNDIDTPFYRLERSVDVLCKEDRFGGMKIVETCRQQLPVVALVASGDTPGDSIASHPTTASFLFPYLSIVLSSRDAFLLVSVSSLP